jgi:hypothetical protein
MRATKGMLLLALVIALAAPATALAQSAGDEQYVDPFQNVPGGGKGGGGNSQGGSGGSNGSQSQTNSGSSQSSTAGNTSQSTASDATSGGDGSALPRTGLPLIGLGVAGGLLLGGGITLRRRV